MTFKETATSGFDWASPDWDREKPTCFWDPGKKLMKSIRDYQFYVNRGIIGLLRSKLCVVRHLFWSCVSGADIPLNCQVCGGMLLPHPNGVVCHPGARIGANCLLFQQVTITDHVVMGFHVDVGAGAKIIGPLTIGDRVIIGANAVVTKDVPSNCTVAGVPARIIKSANECCVIFSPNAFCQESN